MATKLGLTFDKINFKVEKGKIREFVQAIGDKNPLYTSEEAAKEKGFKTIPVPPTFATVVDMWGGLDFDALVAALEVNPLQVLHGEQSYEYIETIYAGDELTAEAEVVKHNSKAGMDFITIETTYKRNGKKVLISRSTIIERHGGNK